MSKHFIHGNSLFMGVAINSVTSHLFKILRNVLRLARTMVVRVTKDQEIYIPFMKLMELRVLIL